MTPFPPAREHNRLLATLPPAERARLQPHLKWVELPAGTTLHEAGVRLRHVHFPATAIVSLISTMEDGDSAEVAVVGKEGIVGVSAFMGGEASHCSAVVQGGGHGWRMDAQALADQAQRSDLVMHQLLRYTQALFTHMAQSSACNRHHALDQQLCRWLLLNLDRQHGHEVTVTQERIASLLGVRREGVTVGALRLQKAGLIRYSRGRIAVLDRTGLEERTCECYAVVKRAYDRLLGDTACRPPAAVTVAGPGADVQRRWPANEVAMMFEAA